jgi:hypothetical protein
VKARQKAEGRRRSAEGRRQEKNNYGIKIECTIILAEKF